MVRRTPSRNVVAPMLAPSPHGSQIMVTRPMTISSTMRIAAWAVPLRWPAPTTMPVTRLLASRTAAYRCWPSPYRL